MQTTLDCINSSVPKVEIQSKNSTMDLSDEYIEYLYEHSHERGIDFQIEQYLQEEKERTDEIKEEFEYLQQFEEFRPQRKPQEYIRVGKHGRNAN